MKKLKFIPVLAVAALLSACGSNGVSVKAPKFAKMGEEVSFEKFDEEINKRFDELDFLKEDLLNSKTLVGKGSSLISEKMTRGKKIITESTMKDSDEAKYELDMKNYIAKMSGESKEEIINKSNSTNSKGTSNNKGVYYVQEAEYEEDLSRSVEQLFSGCQSHESCRRRSQSGYYHTRYDQELSGTPGPRQL